MQRWAASQAIQRKPDGATGLDAAVEAAQSGPPQHAGDVAAASEAPAEVAPEKAPDQAPVASAGAAQTLPASVRRPIERRFGVDLSDVTVHVGERAAEVGALAFAQGREIHVDPGAWDPESADGRQLLGHELTHIVQQQAGRVEAGADGINDDPALEAEADHAGAAAVEGAAEPAAEHAPTAAATASAGPVQRKVTVNKVNAVRHSAASLKQKTVSGLLSYVREQLDWSTGMAEADAEEIRAFITRLTTQPALANGCTDLIVSDVLAALGGADAAAIEKYSQAVTSPRSPPTARIDRVSTMPEAKELGEAVLKMEAAVGGVCLYTISTPETMTKLVTGKFVDSFVDYVKVQQPVLHATNGTELESFYVCKIMGVDLLGLRGDLPKIRNLHRFQPLALFTLAANFKNTQKTRPLTVILHSAVDHNGAFHQDPNLTAVVIDGRFLTIMIEGATTLDAVIGEIDGLAKTYGKNDKISQVMIAGHGGPRGIQLAGTAVPHAPVNAGDEPEMREQLDDVDLDNNPAKADKLFDTLLKNLDTSASGRMVFNACLTGSTEINVDPASADPAELQIANAMKNSPNLTDYLQKRAAAAGVAADVRGANGSFGQVGLADPGDGKLNIVNPDDPALTKSKSMYIEQGMEPEGVLRAVLQLYEDPAGAATKPEWLKRVEARIAARAGGWADDIIVACFEIIHAKYQSDATGIQSLIRLVHPIAVAHDSEEAKPWKLDVLVSHPDARALLAKLGRAPNFNGLAAIVLLQVWTRLEPAKGADLLTALRNRKVSDLETNVDTDRLAGSLGTLLASGAGDLRGQYVLALIDRFTSPHKASEQFLLRELGSADAFDPAKVDAAMLGNRDADSALETIGRGPLVTTGKKQSGDRTEDGNLDLDGDGKNETYADPVQRPGIVSNCSVLRVRKRPSMDAESVHFLKAGDEVFVIGHYKGWDVIMHDDKPAFVGASFITR